MTSTRAQKASTFKHVTETVLGFSQGSPMDLALQDAEYDSVEDLATMDKDEIMELVYFQRKADGSKTDITMPVPMKAKKKLLHLLWWRDYVVSQKSDKTMSDEDWRGITTEIYEGFRMHQAPNIARSGTALAASTTSNSAVTKSQVSDFQKGHKRDVSVYMQYSGDRRFWFRVKRNWGANFAADDVMDVIDRSYVVPTGGTEARALYDAKNRYVYNVFNTCIKGGQAMVIVRQHEVTMDGREPYFGMLDFYERKANLSLIRTQCISEIAEMKLTKNYPGGALKFFQSFQNTYLDLENATGKAIDDDEKIGSLNASLQDDRFAGVRTTIETMALQSGNPINYADYLQSMITHAENLRTTAGRRNANRTEREGTGGGRGKQADGDDAKKWKKDLTAYVPFNEFKKLPEAEKKKRKEAREAAKAAKQTQNQRSMYTLQIPGSDATVTSGVTAQTSGVRTVATTLMQEAGTPATTTQGGSESGPTLREIMAAQTQLPRGTYTDEQGQRFQVNALNRRIRLASVTTEAAGGLCLVDSGANNGLAGADMILLEEAEFPELVDVVGPSDGIQDGMSSLRIGTYGGVLTSSAGVKVLGVFPNFIGYGKGKSILSSNQSAAFGHEVDDRPRRYGGQQRIKTTDGYVFKLKFMEGLSYLPIEYPSPDDLDSLPWVYMTSPGVWNPMMENDDNDDDIWFDASDEEELDESEFLDSRDGWYDVAQMNVARLGRAERKLVPRDYEALRPFLLWKPIEVIKQTFAVTTQFAHNVVRLPLRKHFKSRFPALNVRRLSEIYATDTFFADVKAHDGSTCAQLYCGKTSQFTQVYGMKTESQMPGTLMDFIRSFGAMRGLFSDNAKVETSHVVKDILRLYNIFDLQSEPHHQHQNPAERRIQEVKATTNIVMDRTGCPSFMWLLCMMYVVFILNCLAHGTLDGRTPTEVAFGYTPDISVILCFTFYQKVLYREDQQCFPGGREKSGRFVGFAENIGDALTYMIWTDDTQQLIVRSEVRPYDDPRHPNVRLDVPRGEDDTASTTGDPREFVKSYADVVDVTQRKLPTVDPIDVIGRTFLKPREIDGSLHRAEVMQRVETVDGETEQYLVRLGDGTREEVMTYDAIVQQLDEQFTREADQDEFDRTWIFKSIQDHRKNGTTWEVLMHWEDDSETWEPLNVVWRSDPVTLAKYAEEKNLLNTPGWKRLRRYSKNKKKMNRMLRQVHLNSMRTAVKIKFGVKVPRNHEEAMEFDRRMGATKWQDAEKLELQQLYDYSAFESKGKGGRLPGDHKMIRCRMVYDVKQDGRYKARFVAGGHLTGPNEDTYYSSVVSLRSMRIVLFLAELNDLETCAGDVGNAYLEAYTQEKVCFTAGMEFAPFGHAGHLMKIVKALYGLKSSGSRYHEKFSQTMLELGYLRSKGDQDVWMKDCETHYAYVCVYVDDLIYAGKDAEGFYQALKDRGYKLKGVGPPTYHLGGDFKRVSEPETMLTWGAQTYVKRMMDNYQKMFGEPVAKREIHAPLDPADHPELDSTELCNLEEVKNYWSMIGELQWAVALGRIDIMCAVVTMASYRPQPRKGHLERLKRLYQYLRNYKKTAIKFNTERPDYSKYNIIMANWGTQYHPCHEDIDVDIPEPKGKPVVLTTFVDANLMSDFVTGRSRTGIIHMLNKTPIDWFSKRQSSVETATYGSEFVAARIAVDQIVELRHELRYYGVPLDGPAWMFGDNLAVVNSATMPSGKLQKRANLLNYHRVREAQAAGIVNFVHMDGRYNPADILTKFRSSREWYELLKPILFWRARDDQIGSHIAEGSVSVSAAVPGLCPGSPGVEEALAAARDQNAGRS